MGHGSKAIERARNINVDSIPVRERQARYLIDVARAYIQTNNDAAACRVIQNAHKRAPEYASGHVMAREIVSILLGRERRTITPGLRTLAKKMGII
jgi:hypothetical protein